jgi:predicted nucleic acid-binding protein
MQLYNIRKIMLVIDTSAIIAVLINESHKQQLLKLTDGETLIAPLSLHWEIGNALSAMLKRNRMTHEQAQLAVDSYECIPIRFVEISLSHAVEIAAQQKIYAYDAYMLACALKYRTPLLTLDQGLEQTARHLGINILEVN